MWSARAVALIGVERSMGRPKADKGLEDRSDPRRMQSVSPESSSVTTNSKMCSREPVEPPSITCNKKDNSVSDCTKHTLPGGGGHHRHLFFHQLVNLKRKYHLAETKENNLHLATNGHRIDSVAPIPIPTQD